MFSFRFRVILRNVVKIVDLLTKILNRLEAMMPVLDDIKADVATIKTDLTAIVAKINPTGGISEADAQQLKSDLDGVVASMDTVVNPPTT